MSSNVTLNGVQYVVPAYNDTGWAQGVGNLSLYLVAIASNTLQPTGGAFTLTSELDFGANFGVKQLYLKSETANPASAGVVRLASADTIKWRNNANGADIALSKDASDNLQYNATKVLLSGAVVNADINAAAAIAYSKLALTGSIVSGDLAGSIAVNKLAALTASRAVATDSSGFLTVSATTAAELAFVSGVTSAIQTQLNGKQASGTYIANPLVVDLAAGSHKITGLAAPASAGDALSQNNLVPSSDGTVGNPAHTFSTDTATGLYKIGASDMGVSAGGVKAAEFKATGTTNATTYTPFGVFGGPSNKQTAIDKQTTTGIANSATTILAPSSDASLATIYGKQTVGGTAEFYDVVAFANASVVVIASVSAVGSPGARTYSGSAGALKVLLASGTYTVSASGLTMQG